MGASSGGAGTYEEKATAGLETQRWDVDGTSNRLSHVLLAFAPAVDTTPANLTQTHYRWRNDNGGESGGLDTGTGADGSVTISASQNINTNILGSNRAGNPDGVLTTAASFGSATGGTTLTVAAATGLAANDEIILINLQGDATNNGNVGNYEFLEIQSIASNTLTFESPIQNLYGATTSNLDLTGQNVIVQRVPQWTDVTLQSGGTLTANAWNGTSGGVVVFRATGTVDVQTGGSISANAIGYRGRGSITDGGGINGESYDGVVGSGGDDTLSGQDGGSVGTSGGGTSSNLNSVTPAGTRGGGGGGGNTDGNTVNDGSGGGAGGGYGGGGGGGAGGGDSNAGGSGGSGGGTDITAGGGGGCGDNAVGGNGGNAGSAGQAGSSVGGAAGSGANTGEGGGGGTNTSTGIGAGGGGGGGLYGVTDLSNLFPGSGGGGGGGHDNASAAGATGGDAGGIIYIVADTVTVTGSITSNGANGAIASTTRAGSSGGGSGGSILVQANSATLGTDLVIATGGSGGAGQNPGGGGGSGGVGRIRIESDSITGTTNPTASTAGTPGGGIGASWATPSEDTKLDGLGIDTNIRLRFQVSNEGGQRSDPTVTYQLQAAETATCGSGTYTAVPTDNSGHWQIVDSSYITEPQATSDIPAGLSDPVGGTFVFGEVKEDDNTTGSIPLDACEYTEIEFVIRATGNATNSGDYCFQLYDTTNNKTLSYSKYAEVSLADGTFSYRKPITFPAANVGTSCSADSNEVSATADDTTTSATDVLVNGMTIRWKAAPPHINMCHSMLTEVSFLIQNDRFTPRAPFRIPHFRWPPTPGGSMCWTGRPSRCAGGQRAARPRCMNGHWWFPRSLQRIATKSAPRQMTQRQALQMFWLMG
jgi:hypothetical protein